eukprot:TRINITY_DN34352_c0_g2_i2.p1 TRINITY_DN34352_c0_g2~~TRINITY_DN34352_c0_g2_i2.p1  ORF type:complete len:368 (+),score=48.34 TRINITY_DN34352_c0_g2_i2:115-1218(+)
MSTAAEADVLPAEDAINLGGRQLTRPELAAWGQGEGSRWAELAGSLLRTYRQHDGQGKVCPAGIDGRSPLAGQGAARPIYRLREDVEAAFQMSMPLSVLLTPNIYAFSRWMYRRQFLGRAPPTPPTLDSHFVSGFSAKVIIDVMLYYGPTFTSWLQPLPSAEFEMQPLFTRQHLEVCAASTAMGLAMGRLLTALTEAVQLRFPRIGISPIFTATYAAPLVAHWLAERHLESQFRQASLVWTVASWACRIFSRLWSKPEETQGELQDKAAWDLPEDGTSSAKSERLKDTSAARVQVCSTSVTARHAVRRACLKGLVVAEVASPALRKCSRFHLGDSGGSCSIFGRALPGVRRRALEAAASSGRGGRVE